MSVPKKGAKVLVVDDERAIVDVIRYNLELEGYQVVGAYDGLEGLHKAQSESPDLIILDLMMPKLSGFEVLRDLKHNPRTRKVPVIILTAYPSDAAALVTTIDDADCFLSKPFQPDEMLALVRRILAEKEGEEEGEMEG